MIEFLDFLKILMEKAKPNLEKFKVWFNNEDGVVRAAVIAVLGTFVTGCFVLFAALISRPAPPPVMIVTATAVPTSIPTPTPFLAPTPTRASSTTSSNPSYTPPTPILKWLGSLSQNLSPEMTSLILGTSGVLFIILGLWQEWLIFFNRTEKNKDTIFSVFLVCIIFFTSWQLWGWMPIVIAAGSMGLVPFLIGLLINLILGIPYLGASIIGATITTFIGIGISLLYLAIPGPFVGEYIQMGALVGIVTGTILGLLLSSKYAGHWH